MRTLVGSLLLVAACGAPSSSSAPAAPVAPAGPPPGPAGPPGEPALAPLATPACTIRASGDFGVMGLSARLRGRVFARFDSGEAAEVRLAPGPTRGTVFVRNGGVDVIGELTDLTVGTIQPPLADGWLTVRAFDLESVGPSGQLSGQTKLPRGLGSTPRPVTLPCAAVNLVGGVRAWAIPPAGEPHALASRTTSAFRVAPAGAPVATLREELTVTPEAMMGLPSTPFTVGVLARQGPSVRIVVDDFYASAVGWVDAAAIGPRAGRAPHAPPPPRRPPEQSIACAAPLPIYVRDGAPVRVGLVNPSSFVAISLREQEGVDPATEVPLELGGFDQGSVKRLVPYVRVADLRDCRWSYGAPYP